MWSRLLTKAAVLLAAWMGQVAMADEPGTGEEKSTTTKAIGPDGAASVGQSAGPVASARSDRASLSNGSSRTDGSSRSDGGAVRSSRVVFITAKDSEPCRKELERLRKAGGTFAALEAQGWKIGPAADSHIQIVDRGDVPDVIRQLDPDEFPVVACIENGEIIRSFKDGCSTPLDAWTFGWLLKGVSERPQAAISEAIRVATTGHYPLRGNHWTVDGDTNPTKDRLVTHLRGPNHVNSLQASWVIEEWSIEELRSLHDDIHERDGPWPAANSAPARSTGLEQFSGNRKALGKF
jgi:hypothetical protein